MPVLLAAGAADVVAALAVLLVVWAASILLVKPLTWLLSNLPVIGSEIADRLARGMDAVVTWAADWAKSAVGAVVQIVSVPVTWLGTAISSVLGFAGDVVGNLLKLIGQAASLAGEIAHNLTVVLAKVATLAGEVAANAAAVVVKIATAVQTLTDLVHKAVNTAYATLSAAISAAIAAETALIAQAKGSILAIIAGQAGVFTATLNATAATLRQEWATDLKGIDLRLDGLGQVLAPVLALDLALVIPQLLTEIKTLRRDCVDPLCGILGPALGALGAVQDVATLAIVGGVVGEAIANPEGTARATASVADEVHSLAADLFGLFTGARA